MLFNCSLQNGGIGISRVVSGNTWGDVASYCEGTGMVIQSINIMQQNLIVNDGASTTAYQLSLKDDVTNLVSVYFIFDTYQNVMSWVSSQTGKTLQALSTQKTSFVQL